MKIHTKIFVVSPSAIDKRNHVNNLTYLQWCLDAAEKHWNDVAPKNFQENYVWYVINHNINYKAASFEGEKLELTTWIAKNEGVKSDRHYKIIRLSDQKIIIEATTTWCLVNEKTLRPTKITEEISTLFD
jgi:acyl-CoA thioester hydrolase